MKKDKIQHLRDVPRLRFKNFIDKYELKNIGAISTRITAGGTPATKVSSYWINGEIPWMSSGEVNKRELYGTEKKITKSGLDNSSSKMIKSQSVLMALAGQGKTRGMVAVNEIPLCTNQSIAAIEVDGAEIDYKYLFYNLHKDYNKLRRLSSTGEGRGGINLKFISRWKLNIPSLDEQHKVASFISNLDHKISLFEYKLENIKLFKKGLYKKVFGSLINTHKSFLKKICTIKKGTQLNKSNMLDEGNYYVLNGGQNPSGKTNNYNTLENTISISEGGNSCGFVTFNKNRFWSGGHLYTVHNICENIDLYYLYHYLKYQEKKIMRLRVGSGLPNIQKSTISKFIVEYPKMNLQKEISSSFEDVDNKIVLLEKKLENLKQFKKGLLQQMFI